ncbi:MAG: histidinol-phosphatase [Lachnospiraceae bacterium]|nr:histidinol-phosphatase [Lachnospiraceae bacterium]
MSSYRQMNLHSHTFRCGHAEGDTVDYAAEAVKNKMLLLGISDHTPFPEKRDENTRMEPEQMPDYIAGIEKAREKFPELQILKGLECDYTEEYLPFYQSLRNTYSLDYLIGSAHFYYENGERISVFKEPVNHKRMNAYMEQVIGAIDSGMFLFIAHPDLFCLHLERWDDYVESCVREICREAEQKKMPLEINVSGYLKGKDGSAPFPKDEFWRIVSDYDIGILINSDAHTVPCLCQDKEKGYALQQKYHLRQWNPAFNERKL